MRVADAAAFERAGADFFVVDAAAVVFYFDEDVIAAMIGADGQAAFFGFAVARASFRLFDSVRYGIADQVNQRIGNLLNNIVVELGFRALQN